MGTATGTHGHSQFSFKRQRLSTLSMPSGQQGSCPLSKHGTVLKSFILLDSCQSSSSSVHACHEVRATLSCCALVTFPCAADTKMLLQRASPG